MINIKRSTWHYKVASLWLNRPMAKYAKDFCSYSKCVFWGVMRIIGSILGGTILGLFAVAPIVSLIHMMFFGFADGVWFLDPEGPFVTVGTILYIFLVGGLVFWQWNVFLESKRETVPEFLKYNIVGMITEKLTPAHDNFFILLWKTFHDKMCFRLTVEPEEK